MRYSIAILLILANTAWAANDVCTTGSMIEPFELSDQHGKPHTVNEYIRLIIFASDREASDIVHEALKSHNDTYLSAHQTVYILDISAIPSIICRMFVLPKMRKYSYSVLLDKKSDTTHMLPRKQGHVTLIKLDKMVVESVKFVHSSGELTRAIKKAAVFSLFPFYVHRLPS
ncbi:MAG: hypothetical protein IMF11_19900 [Proteobacteria bacterium]|nr:hypothetical protein [Pseudomonadota bacterium]